MNNTELYRDVRRPVAERVADLVARMTLEEKVAQLGSVWVYELLANGEHFDPEQARTRIPHGIGQITRVAGASHADPTQTARLANTIQRFLVEETRLGIPAMIHEECCAGFMARGATCFPQIIGVASTWDPDLVAAMAREIRRQMRAVGAHQGLSPVLDVARDPRWGRLEETFGEDPYLVARMGTAYVQALQGEDLRQGILATGKHFVGYGLPLAGMNWAPAFIPPRELWETYIFPFQAAIQEANLGSMMNAYHELDGIPCGASRELLTDILRNKLGFQGIVVSDYTAIHYLVDYHRYARDYVEAAQQALAAGMDVELPTADCFGPALVEGVRTGRVDPDLVAQAVRRVLEMKFRLGIFDHPYVEEGEAIRVFETEDQRLLARTLAHKSMVLLKNEGGLLPLSPDLDTVAVIGPNADSIRNLLGDYHYPAHIELLARLAAEDKLDLDTPRPDMVHMDDNYPAMQSVLQAIREAVSPATRVRYARGCDVNSPDRSGFDEAVATAREADVAILVMGDKSGLTPDCTSGEFRDRATLGLPGVQGELVRAVWETGTPVVLVLVSGRPVSDPWIAARVPAILMAWLPGEEGGPAIADVLFGRVNPGGRLPVTVVRSVGQVPMFYNHRPSGQRSYLYGDYVDEAASPLYPFGHGLSYTTFTYGDVSVTPDQVTAAETVQIGVEVRNSGDRAGDEVVQLYVRVDGASVPRPVQELKGFVRVSLAPGERRRVRFHLPVAALAYLDRAMQWAVEPVTVTVMVGSSSADIRGRGQFRVIEGAVFSGPRSLFSRSTVEA